MIEEDRVADPTVGVSVTLRGAGEQAKGAFRCADCGYGIAVAAALPACPMCAGTTWEEAAWSPFGRAGEPL